MLTISYEQFARKIHHDRAQLERFVRHDLPNLIGREAVSYFKKNFQNEGFGRSKWKEVQRRQGWTRTHKYSKPAARSRKILTGSTGDLGRSIEYKIHAGGMSISITSDLIYAAVHNYGLRAGRGKGFTMPQRQFIGNDPELIEHLNKVISKRIKEILS